MRTDPSLHFPFPSLSPFLAQQPPSTHHGVRAALAQRGDDSPSLPPFLPTGPGAVVSSSGALECQQGNSALGILSDSGVHMLSSWRCGDLGRLLPSNTLDLPAIGFAYKAEEDGAACCVQVHSSRSARGGAVVRVKHINGVAVQFGTCAVISPARANAADAALNLQARGAELRAPGRLCRLRTRPPARREEPRAPPGKPGRDATACCRTPLSFPPTPTDRGPQGVRDKYSPTCRWIFVLEKLATALGAFPGQRPTFVWSPTMAVRRAANTRPAPPPSSLSLRAAGARAQG